jgi:hypothetical protein
VITNEKSLSGRGRLALDGRGAAILATAFWLLALALQLPGNVPYDGIVVWHEAETGRLYAQHPAALVLIWRLCGWVVRGPALFTALSLATLWTAAGLLLARNRPPLWAGMLFAALLLLWPPLLATAGVTVKDVIGAHLVLLAFALADGRHPARWFAAFAAGTLAFLLRYQLGLILPVLAILWWQARDRRTAIAAVAGMIVPYAVVSAAVALLFVTSGPGDVLLSLRKMAIFDIAGIVAHDRSAPLADFAQHGVDVPRLKQEIAAQYSPVRVDTLWQTKEEGSITPASGVFGRLYRVPDSVVLQQWRSAVATRPWPWLEHRGAAFGKVLGFGDIWQCRPLTAGISWLPREAAAAVGANTYAAPWSARMMTVLPVSLTFRAVLYGLVLIAVAIVGPRPAVLLAGFGLAYELSFLLLPQACEVRYSYPVMLVAVVAAAMTLRRRFIL